MTELIPGKRYRWTIEGVATGHGSLNDDSGNVRIFAWLRHGTVELLPDPLPTTPGSVILDRVGDAFQLVEVAHGENVWRSHASRSAFRASEIAFERELTPITVLFDAGAER